MSDQAPHVARSWPPRAAVTLIHRVGVKCVVQNLGDGWLSAHGVSPQESERVRGATSADSDAAAIDVGPWGSGAADKSQARLYFHPGGQEQPPDVRIILPNDAPFRRSRKGMRKDHSKSFNSDGTPVWEVLLLYALKTRQLDDRLRAVEDCPKDDWGCDTYGEFWAAMDTVARTEHRFSEFAGEHLAAAAASEGELGNWSVWEKVAEEAAAYTRDRDRKASGNWASDTHALLIQALKETATEHRGLPAQVHVRERWESLGGIGDWKNVRETLGLKWIPAKQDWNRYWKQRAIISRGGPARSS